MIFKFGLTRYKCSKTSVVRENSGRYLKGNELKNRYKMKKRIIVEYGEVKRIAHLMNCTQEMVSHSLAFRKDTKLARAIRKMALMRGGVEVGNEPVNDVSHESDMVGAVR